MKEALKAFREESDQLHRFIEAECTLDVNAKIPSSQLYAAYANWARNTKEFQLKEKLFKKNMEMKGFANTRSKAGVLFHGLTTKNTYYGSGGNHVDLEE